MLNVTILVLTLALFAAGLWPITPLMILLWWVAGKQQEASQRLQQICDEAADDGIDLSGTKKVAEGSDGFFVALILGVIVFVCVVAMYG